MKYDEYITSLSEQIQDKRAKVLVCEEIKNHIEEQCEAYEIHGMEHEAALDEAVRQMGDPVNVGAELNKIHRPQIPIRLLVVALTLTIAGIVMQSLLIITNGYYAHLGGSAIINSFVDYRSAMGPVILTVVYNLIGLLVMVILLYKDYTFISRFAYSLWLIYIEGSIFTAIFLDLDYYLSMRGAYYISLFYPIILAGLIYRNRNKKEKGLIYCILCTALTLLILSFFYRVTFAWVEAFIISAIILCIAIGKKVFGGERKKQWVIMIAMGLIILVGIIVFMQRDFTSEYQLNRILYAVTGYGDSGGDNILADVRENMKKCTLWGNRDLFGAIKFETITSDKYFEEFILSSIFSWFGIIAGVAVILAMGYLIYKIFRMALRQRNRIGMLVAVACGSSLMVRLISCTLMNFGIGFYYITMFPFLGFGLFNNIFTGIFMGLIISVARNTMIMSENNSDKREEWTDNFKKLDL